MKKIFILFFIFFLIVNIYGVNKKEMPYAKDGALDLSSVEFNKNTSLRLNGEWAYFDNFLLEPDDINSSLLTPKYVAVPSSWVAYTIDNKAKSAYGYGTFYLIVKLKKTKFDKILLIPSIGSAYNLWINGQKYDSVGKASSNKDDFKDITIKKDYKIDGKYEILEIIIQVSNYTYKNAGLWDNISIMSEHFFFADLIKRTAFEMFVFGTLIIMSFYHLGLFPFRKKDRISFYYSMICLIFGVRIFLLSDVTVYLFPQFYESDFTKRIEFLTFIASVPFFLAYLGEVYYTAKTNILIKLIYFYAYACGILLFILPIKYVDILILAPYQILTVFVCIYVLVVALKNSFSSKENAAFLFFLIILAITIINDLLYANSMIFTGYYTVYGLFVFMFGQSVFSAIRYSRAFSLKENLSENLLEINQENASLYYILARNFPDGAVFIIDTEMRFIIAEGMEITQFRYPREAIPGKKPSDIFDRQTFIQIEKIIKNTFEGNSSKIELTLGKSCYLVQTIAIRNTNNKIFSVMLLMQNITERKKSEIELISAKERADSANVAKSRFLANMSHEIRTPLNSIILIAELLKNSKLNKEQYESAKIIENSAKNLTSIINQILDFSRIESGKTAIDKSPTNIREIIRHTIDSFTPSIKENVELVYYVDDNIPELLNMDSTKYKQVLLNIIGNAVKFTETGYIYIIVTLKEKSKNICDIKTIVEDTGIGIPDTKINSLFSAFTQADDSINKKYGGTGLGLAISKELIEAMDGKISVKSKHNVGSLFEFNMPVLSIKEYKPISVPKISVVLLTKNRILKDFFNEVLVSKGIIVYNSINENEVKNMVFSAQEKPIFFTDLKFISISGNEKLLYYLSENSINGRVVGIRRLNSSLKEKEVEKKFTHFLRQPVNQDDVLNLLNDIINMVAHPEENTTSEERQNSQEIAAKVLLIEDNEINLKTMYKLLTSMNLDVSFATTGSEAYEEFENKEFDVVLMDIQLPDTDGFELTNLFRNSITLHKRTIPIIALTAHATTDYRETCLSSGMDGFVTKPVDIGLLYKEIIRLVKSKSPKIPTKNVQFEKKKSYEEEIFDEAFKIFISTMPKTLIEIQSAINNNDFETLRRITHRIKGTTGMLKSETLYSLIIEMEKKAKEESLNEFKKQFIIFETEVKKLQ